MPTVDDVRYVMERSPKLKRSTPLHVAKKERGCDLSSKKRTSLGFIKGGNRGYKRYMV